jgi:hypothetical protein
VEVSSREHDKVIHTANARLITMKNRLSSQCGSLGWQGPEISWPHGKCRIWLWLRDTRSRPQSHLSAHFQEEQYPHSSCSNIQPHCHVISLTRCHKRPSTWVKPFSTLTLWNRVKNIQYGKFCLVKLGPLGSKDSLNSYASRKKNVTSSHIYVSGPAKKFGKILRWIELDQWNENLV